MIFLTHENNFYELLREYLVSNLLMYKDLSAATFNDAAIARCRELGFKYIEDYCRYVMILPFLPRLEELRLLISGYQPFVLFQYAEQLESITEPLVRGMMEAKSELAKEKDRVARLKKILTTPLDEIKPEEPNYFQILITDALEGEEAYSIAFRLKTIIPETVTPKIIALEPDPRMIEKCKRGIFNPGKAMNLKDNYRFLYLEKTDIGWFKVVDSVRDILNFRKFNVFSQNLEQEYIGQFDIISCNNAFKLYPSEVAKIIVEKMARYLAPGGLLLVSIPEGMEFPEFSCLDKANLGNSRIYRRNNKEFSDLKPDAFSSVGLTLLNRMVQAKAFFLNDQTDEARKIVDEVLHKHIDSLKWNFLKGDIYLKKNQLDKALLQYSKVALINPNSPAAIYNSALIYWIKNDRDNALKSLETIERRLPNCNPRILRDNYDISIENFQLLCSELKEKILANEQVKLDSMRERVKELKETKLEVPNVEIPDPFQKKKDTEEKQSAKQSSVLIDTSQRIVVNIAELPSSRDYGEHDPWKKKMKELEEKFERGEISKEEFEKAKMGGAAITAIATEEKKVPSTEDAVETPESPLDKKASNEVEETESDVDFKMPRTLEAIKTETPPPERMTRRGKKAKQKRKPKPPAPPMPKLYLKPISPDSLGISEEEEEEEETSDVEEIEEETESDEETAPQPAPKRLPIGKLKLSLRRTADEGILPVKEIGLPANFVHSLETLIIKEDINGIKTLISSYSGLVSPKQQEILKLMEKLILVAERTKKGVGKKGEYKGKLKEAYEEIIRIKKYLAEKNLLEASILFHKVIKMRAMIDSLPEFQKNRLKAIRKEIEYRKERYQQFIDQYFEDPFRVFQKELWEILAHLTPPSNLLETGIKYGLDPNMLEREDE